MIGSYILERAEARIAYRNPDEIIYRQGIPMFERWWLSRTPSGETGGNVYLHRWLRSDAEVPHDHPWASRTTVLKGWLEEVSWIDDSHLGWPGNSRLLLPGNSLQREAEEIHAITACEPGTITLFETGQKVRDWGFWVDRQFVPWREYHSLPAAAEQVAS